MDQIPFAESREVFVASVGKCFEAYAKVAHLLCHKCVLHRHEITFDAQYTELRQRVLQHPRAAPG